MKEFTVKVHVYVTTNQEAFGIFLNDVDIWLAEIVDSFYVFFNMFSKYDEKLVIHT